jgi:hypothetical protein
MSQPGRRKKKGSNDARNPNVSRRGSVRDATPDVQPPGRIKKMGVEDEEEDESEDTE